MNCNDIFESVSSGIDGKKTPENGGMEEISNELHRRCKLYEEELRNGKKHVSHFEVEQRIAESYAKEHGLWIPMDDVFNLGVPGPSGNENDTYVSDNVIYKVNNLLNSGSIAKLLKKIILHNQTFPETQYKLYGFAGYDSRSVCPVLMQGLVKYALPATQIEIDMFMAALGFNKSDIIGKYFNNRIEVWDIVPRNVLKDTYGDMYVIDAEIKEIFASSQGVVDKSLSSLS